MRSSAAAAVVTAGVEPATGTDAGAAAGAATEAATGTAAEGRGTLPGTPHPRRGLGRLPL